MGTLVLLRVEAGVALEQTSWLTTRAGGAKIVSPLDPWGSAEPLNGRSPWALLGGGVPMSDSPCTGCRATNRGRLFFVYVNHYVEDEVGKRRARLCQGCVYDLLAPLLEHADYLENGSWQSQEIVTGQVTHTQTAPVAAEPSAAAPTTRMSTTAPPRSESRSADPAGSPLPPRPSQSSPRLKSSTSSPRAKRSTRQSGRAA